MGNRAVITDRNKKLGIYLHWNGGRDSVEAFLKYCELQGYRGFPDDYAFARLTQTIANFFGSEGLSVGVLPYSDDVHMDPGDNGIYVVNNWEIVKRITRHGEQRIYDMTEMLLDIDASQPEETQLGSEFIYASEVPVGDIKIGDEVYVRGLHGGYKKVEVIGFGDDELVNGHRVNGVPYVNIYGSNPSKNINNYLTEPTYRVS